MYSIAAAAVTTDHRNTAYVGVPRPFRMPFLSLTRSLPHTTRTALRLKLGKVECKVCYNQHRKGPQHLWALFNTDTKVILDATRLTTALHAHTPLGTLQRLKVTILGLRRLPVSYPT